ncbi:MAG: hypothetical protein K2J46_07240 [Muribaculaceae bacterium]|nr:hypothetical protein [Muribaculaceae bacterium]
MKTFISKMVALMACVVVMMLTGCVKNEFKIDFEFPKDHIGNYLLTYYAWDSRGGRWIEQTASIQEGAASAGCITRLPTLVNVRDASLPNNNLIIYAERGDEIKVAGEGTDMSTWTVKGNKLSERWSEWRKEAYKKKNDSKALEKSIEDYIKKNPSDQLSAILLLTEWNRRENPEGFVKLWNSVDNGVKDKQLIEMCGAPDLLGVEFAMQADGKLKYAKDPNKKILRVRSRDNGLDTLKFTKAKGSILFFYSENDSERRETTDSLKELCKAYPDSAKRIIADIYMDSDSMTWISAIRRDSLKGTVRGWQPRGVAEDDMVKMGVIRLPWYIVKDKMGKETYAGDDRKSAVAAFRKLMDKKDPKPSTNEKPKDKSAVDKPIPERKPAANKAQPKKKPDPKRNN